MTDHLTRQSRKRTRTPRATGAADGAVGTGGAHGALSGRMLLLLAVTCGAAVGNVYFPQAISPLIASGLGIPPGSATLVVTAAQLGYTAGILLLVPLGDRFAYRPLLVTLLGLTGLGLLGAGAAPGLPPLAAASALVGVTTVIAPLVGPMTAGLVPKERLGAVGGTLASGGIGGMLLSRTLGGALGEWLGWRAPYLFMAVVALLLAALLARALPRQRTDPATDLATGLAADPSPGPAKEPATAPAPAPAPEPEPASRHRLPAPLVEPLRLLRTEPALRRSCFCQAMLFGGFSAVWTSVALLLTSPAYGMGARAVGLLALVNAATMLCTPFAGRQADRRGPDAVNLTCALGVVASAAVLAFGGLGGTPGLAALVLGTLLLDIGMQSGTVANTVRIYALRPEIRSRLTTAFMTCSYLGGSVGSWLGTRAYAAVGWPGVCALVAAAALAAAVVLARRRPAPPSAA